MKKTVKLLAFAAALFMAFGVPDTGLARVYAAGRIYYVDHDNGSDSYDGLSVSKSFRTLNYAAGKTRPGDTVYILGGTYTETDGQAVLHIQNSGSEAEGYITFKAYENHKPVIHATDGWDHVRVEGACYIRIEGLTVQGNTSGISHETAMEEYRYYLNCKQNNLPVDWNRVDYVNTNGITIKSNSAGDIPHHIEVRNNTVYECPGGGIVTTAGDYITIEDNVSHDNCFRNFYASSGISLFHVQDVDDNTGFKNFIRHNISYNNVNYIPWADHGDGTQLSDGNGIIVDDNKNTQINKAPYNGKTKVENNIVYGNGGAGIQVFSSRNVDVVNNTSYCNSRNLDYGEIYANSSDFVNIVNNICVAAGNKPVNQNWNNTKLYYDYNVLYNGSIAVKGDHDIVADPYFSDAAGGNFFLKANSPAIDSGTSYLAPAEDYRHLTRPQAGVIDRGAYEIKNLLLNPGFENGEEEWSIGSNSAVSRENMYMGNQSIKLTGKAAWTNWLQHTVVSNVPQGYYTVRFWVKGTGIDYSSVSIKNGGGELVNTSFQVTSSWDEVKISDIYVPEGAGLVLGVWTQGQAGGYVYYDNFQMYRQ